MKKDTSIALRLRARWLIEGWAVTDKLPAGDLTIYKKGRIDFTLKDGRRVVSVPLALTEHQFHGSAAELELTAGSHWYVFQALDFKPWAGSGFLRRNNNPAEALKSLDEQSQMDELLEKYSELQPDTEPIIAVAEPKMSLAVRGNPLFAEFLGSVLASAVFVITSWFLRNWLARVGVYSWLNREYFILAPRYNAVIVLPYVLPFYFPLKGLVSLLWRLCTPKTLTLPPSEALPGRTSPSLTLSTAHRRRSQFLKKASMLYIAPLAAGAIITIAYAAATSNDYLKFVSLGLMSIIALNFIAIPGWSRLRRLFVSY